MSTGSLLRKFRLAPAVCAKSDLDSSKKFRFYYALVQWTYIWVFLLACLPQEGRTQTCTVTAAQFKYIGDNVIQTWVDGISMGPACFTCYNSVQTYNFTAADIAQLNSRVRQLS